VCVSVCVCVWQCVAGYLGKVPLITNLADEQGL